MTPLPANTLSDPAPVIRSMAALGSSFAAGPGIEPVIDAGAMRSGQNYAHLVAQHLGADLVDLTVSGATTANILIEPQQTMAGATYPPQLDGVPGDADLVTITAGGNDLQLVGSMLFTAWTNLMSDSPIAQMLAPSFPDGIRVATSAEVDGAARGLERIVDAVRGRAPGARIVLVDYLTILGRDAAPHSASQVTFDAPFTAEQCGILLDLQESVGEAHRSAQSRSGADLISVSSLSELHGIGSVTPWVFGFEPDMAQTARSFHPNLEGMRHVAGAVIEQLTR